MGDAQPERLGGLEVDHQLECRGPLRRLRAFENLIDECGDTAGPIKRVVRVTHETTELHEFCIGIHGWQADRLDKLDDPVSMAIHETVMHHNERLGTRFTRSLVGLCKIFGALHF